ncbi:MAG: tRNA (adenosine(37)-N6)-threonylcarbamoyltransferase complex transferase subunit TsaD [Spirochaetes bacterium GWF1_51_8]|nr:MAG: tRNA (adenosine(37)-N6)-threonylcarbamoyltransferase complex transferase subunit TsaD [Spirochaetes bacterium GWF1_51_8]
MLILGIESSCDETSAALVADGKRIVSNTVFSQIEIHKKFNGVVPEVASRNHLIKILDVVDEALGGAPLDTVDAVAVTNGPGLLGSLLVGLSTAKAIAFTQSVPLIPVNHIESHMYAPHLTNDIPFPYIALVVSGGHSLILKVDSFQDYELLGTTIDDAAGEAFDKVAKVLGLGYPGGPEIDKAAKNGDPGFMKLPRMLSERREDRYNFSYSGLKTAVAFRMKGMTLDSGTVADVAASFQSAAVAALIEKSLNAIRDTGIKRLVVSGGVAANSCLRSRLDELRGDGIEVYTAELAYCGDNAAMVAGRGYVDFLAGKTGGMKTDAYSRLPLVQKGKRVFG